MGMYTPNRNPFLRAQIMAFVAVLLVVAAVFGARQLRRGGGGVAVTGATVTATAHTASPTPSASPMSVASPVQNATSPTLHPLLLTAIATQGRPAPLIPPTATRRGDALLTPTPPPAFVTPTPLRLVIPTQPGIDGDG